MSWRDGTSQEIQDDLDELLNVALDSAQVLLRKNREFFPFALTIDAAGALQFEAAHPGQGEAPPSQGVLEALYFGVTEGRAARRAAAFVADVRWEGQDAVRVQMEHRDGGPAIAVLTPYRQKRLSGAVAFGQPANVPVDRRVWPPE